MTASDVDRALHARYPGDPWFYFSQVRAATGYDLDRTIDGLAVNVWPSSFEVLAFEVKVSRGDFLRELADPAKRRPFVERSTGFYFVCPAGLIKPEEVPVECGLLWVHEPSEALAAKAEEAGTGPPALRIVRKKLAQPRELKELPAGFFAACVRKAAAGPAYLAAPLRIDGEDKTVAEFLASVPALIAKAARSSVVLHEIRQEVRAKEEEENGHPRTVIDALRASGLDFPYLWGDAAKVRADVAEWAAALKTTGGVSSAKARGVRFAVAQLVKALEKVLPPAPETADPE